MVYNTVKAYTDIELLSMIKSVSSLSQLIESLGSRPAGGNYNTVRKLLKRLNADTTHWTGKGWSSGMQLKNLEEYTKSVQIKKHLIVERDHKCEMCNLTTWLNKPITLELEHSDGDKYNNDRTNLKLLCPNCHSQTKTWRGRKNIGTSIHHFKS